MTARPTDTWWLPVCVVVTALGPSFILGVHKAAALVTLSCPISASAAQLQGQVPLGHLIQDTTASTSILG